MRYSYKKGGKCSLGWLLSIAVVFGVAAVEAEVADTSVEAELESFQIDSQYEVNLFADESMGIANPICMKWDSKGRLWVLCSSVYPQAELGKKPNDKLVILEDTNNDGRADKSHVFLAGLNMPTGFALGHGGVYIGQGRDLLFFKDTDGDLKADSKELLFTGFGTGDTHQNINSFYWTPGGELLFCQGLHCFSRVETPWGIRRLDEHGSWRLRPLRRELDTFVRTSGGGNPWGFAFGKWGEPFIKSNGPGVCELLPALVPGNYNPGSYWAGEMKIGSSRIKSMILERVDSAHLPDDLQGDLLIAGYYARNIARLDRLEVSGSGHKAKRLTLLMTSTDGAFRPVDIKTGPEGALYIADWYNPIIGHYQASFRHPKRDKTHGRVWRITAKGKKVLPVIDVSKMNAAKLCSSLTSSNSWVRHQAKIRLMELPKQEVVAAVGHWVKGLSNTDKDLDYQLFQAIGVLESHEVVDEVLLGRLIQSKQYLARAYAARVVGRWHDRLKAPLSMLSQLAGDEYSRVRLEVMVSSSYIPKAESVLVATKSLRRGRDRFIDYAFKKVVNALRKHWKPAMMRGSLAFENGEDMLSLLSAVHNDDITAIIRKSIETQGLDDKVKVGLLGLLAEKGGSEDVILLLRLSSDNPNLLKLLVQNVEVKKTGKPKGADVLLKGLLASPKPSVKANVIQLSALWKIREFSTQIEQLAMDEKQPESVRIAAVHGLKDLKGRGALTSLSSLMKSKASVKVKLTAIESLLEVDLPSGLKQAITLLKSEPKQVNNIVTVIMRKKGALERFGKQLTKDPVSKDTALAIKQKLNTSGVKSDGLMKVLNELMGSAQAVAKKYNQGYVNALTKEVHASGDAKNGKRVFLQASLSCVACHKVQGVKEAVGILGPDLSAVGSGLSTEMIIESILWPNKEIKEGYASTTVETKQGKIVVGTIMKLNQDSVEIKESSTGKVVKISVKDIKSRKDGQSTMPEGLVSSLNRKDLRDLMKYMSELKK